MSRVDPSARPVVDPVREQVASTSETDSPGACQGAVVDRAGSSTLAARAGLFHTAMSGQGAGAREAETAAFFDGYDRGRSIKPYCAEIDSAGLSIQELGRFAPNYTENLRLWGGMQLELVGEATAPTTGLSDDSPVIRVTSKNGEISPPAYRDAPPTYCAFVQPLALGERPIFNLTLFMARPDGGFGSFSTTRSSLQECLDYLWDSGA